MTATTEADKPVLKHTPGGWMAEATDSPLIAVVADTEAEAVDLFRTRRAVWRALMAEAASKDADDRDAPASRCTTAGASGGGSPGQAP